MLLSCMHTRSRSFPRLRRVAVPALLFLCCALCLCACVKQQAKAPPERPAIEKEQTLTAGSDKGSRPNTYGPRKGSPPPEATAVPRADPGYLQWLEKQSMLTDATEMARIVSGSELPWRAAPSGGGGADVLLGAADIWLDVHPQSLLTDGSRPVFRELDDSALTILQRAGIRGLFIAPTGDSGAVWKDKNDAAHPDAGEDVVSLKFAETLGTDKDFEQLRLRAEKRGMQMGGDIISPAAGIGPDFLLATRAVREYPGAFLMVEIPRAAWNALPPASKPTDLPPINAEQLALLSRERLLPPAMTRDTMLWTVAGGWAATGEIRCNDGQLRRWAYRRYTQADRPLLNWDDPSGAAQRILSGSVIREVGLLRQALAGIRIEPLLGLDAAYGSGQRSLEPGLSALRALSREIRRYGGWSIQRDALPADVDAQVREAGADFGIDTTFSPAAEYALLTGDAAPLRVLVEQRRGLDHRRAVHRMPGPDGILLSALDGAPFPPDARARFLHALENAPTAGSTLYITGPELALAAAKRGGEARPEAALEPHMLLTSLYAVLPGLFFVSGSDLAGALNIQGTPAEYAALGGWAITASAASRAATRKGFAKARALYPLPQSQLAKPGSYLSRLSAVSALRARTRAAQGSLAGTLPTEGESVLAVLNALPDGGRLLAVANFSPKARSCRVSLPKGFDRVTDELAQKALAPTGDRLALELEPWACRILRLEAGSAASAPPAAKEARPQDEPAPGETGNTQSRSKVLKTPASAWSAKIRSAHACAAPSHVVHDSVGTISQ